MTIEDVDSVEIQHVTHNGINYTITKNAALLIAQSNTHSTSWTPKTVHHAERQSSHPFAVLLEEINTADIKHACQNYPTKAIIRSAMQPEMHITVFQDHVCTSSQK